MEKEHSQDLKIILKTATEDLDIFSQTGASRLDVGEDGRLTAPKESRLERVVGLARCYIGLFFSGRVWKEQEEKLLAIKKAVLRARDIMQTHMPLIEKFKEGDEDQRNLVESALLVIQRYNAIVGQESSEVCKPDVYNYERQRLLLDREIKGQQIELPHVVCIKYDWHPNGHPAQKMLKELSEALRSDVVKKNPPAISPTHKKSIQFMIDTFHMKAIRMIEVHLQKSVAEIVPLVKQKMPEIDEASHSDFMTMRQLIEVDVGSVILVTGCFRRHHADSKFMTMPIPILDSFKLSFELTHTGFPYPSEHIGWALDDEWIKAFPLRTNQLPCFQEINQRRKRLVNQLLFDQEVIQKLRYRVKMKREIFDQNRHIFLPLHSQLQQALLQQSASLNRGMNPLVIETFFQEAGKASSPFDLLTQTQQQILNLFIKQPLRALEEEWLEVASSPLRIGSPEEKLHSVCLKLAQHRKQVQVQLDPTHYRDAYILQQGLLLSEAFESVAVRQYRSETMGLPPPFLNDFERRLQACAFQQLLTFLEECEQCLDVLDPARIKSDLLIALSKDLKLFEAMNEESEQLPVMIVNELENYFNSRFYSDRDIKKRR